MGLLAPLGLLGLLGLPTLWLLYFLIGRAKSRQVSSLFLWEQEPERTREGKRFTRASIPPLFWLELACLILLGLALAQPFIILKRQQSSLIVLLDDSQSMLAGKPSSRERAERTLRSIIKQEAGQEVRFLLAGIHPKTLPPFQTGTDNLANLLQQWQCFQPESDLVAGLQWAKELANPFTRILVLTDQAPPTTTLDSRVLWRAQGTAIGNVGFTRATRRHNTQEELVSYTIGNYSDESQTTRVWVNDQVAETVTMPPRTTHFGRLRVPTLTSEMTLRLDEDEFRLDDQVLLAPPYLRSPRLSLRIKDPALRNDILQALTSTGKTVLVNDQPDLLISDDDHAPQSTTAWWLRIHPQAGPESYSGPYFSQEDHPLLSGFSATGLIWNAANQQASPPFPILSVGEVPLIWEEGGQPNPYLHLAYHRAASTFGRSPNWPIFFWNLVDWRLNHLPGPASTNVAIGLPLTIRTTSDQQTIRMTTPNHQTSELAVNKGVVTHLFAEPGLHRLAIGDQDIAIGVQALSAGESDFSSCITESWGTWQPSVEKLGGFDLSSIIIWLLLVLMAGHLWAIRGANSKGLP